MINISQSNTVEDRLIEFGPIGLYLTPKYSVDYTGYYEASTSGVIRSCKRLVETNRGIWSYTSKIMTQYPSSRGYPQVKLSKNGKTLTIDVHQLVMLAHKPNRDESLNSIDHIDEDKTNNNLSNLQYMTKEDNTRKSNTGRIFTKEHKSKLSLAKLDRKLSIETRKKMSISAKKGWVTRLGK